MKARAYATVGELAACRHHIGLAEQAFDLARTGGWEAPSWVERLAQPAYLAAATGHALATVAHRTAEPADLQRAGQRLAAAVAGFDPVDHARARALCLARLATLQLAAGDLDQSAQHTRQALEAVAGIRSARLIHAITRIRAAAADQPDPAPLSSLIEEIDTSIGAPEVDPDQEE